MSVGTGSLLHPCPIDSLNLGPSDKSHSTFLTWMGSSMAPGGQAGWHTAPEGSITQCKFHAGGTGRHPLGSGGG
eukprot:1119034-Amphidinium_carterae.1